MLKFLVNAILIAIIVYNVWTGYRKGLILSLFSIIALIIALIAANLIADTFHNEFTDVVNPFIGGVVDKFAGEEMTETDEDGNIVSVISDADASDEQRHDITLSTLTKLGLSEKEAEKYTETICTKMQETGSGITEQITETMCDAFTYTAVLIIAFFMLIIIFTAIGNLINLTFRIPGVRYVNEIGGAVFGLIRGLIFVMLIAWLVGYLGLILPDGLVENSGVLKFFFNHNPMIDLLSTVTAA